MTARQVSVVIPTYNRRATLERALRSVLKQTHPAHEIIIVDDGSTDGTADYVAAIARDNDRIRLIQAEHAGAAAARNLGIREAGGELIAFQDSDDEWHDDFLARLLPLIGPDSETVAFCSHRVHYRDGTSSIVPPFEVPDASRALLTHSVISMQTAVIPAGLMREVMFDEQLRRFQDWALWLSLIRRGGVEFVHDARVGVEVYRLEDSISEGAPHVRSASLRRILRSNVALFTRHPWAFARLSARAFLRPGVASRHTAVPTDLSGETKATQG